jgi:TolB protein
LLLLPAVASAQLRIEIVDGVEGAMPIAVAPFAWESDLPEPATIVSQIISANLPDRVCSTRWPRRR